MIKHIGDMAFIEVPGQKSDHHGRARRNAVISQDNLWPSARIPYVISTSFNGEFLEYIILPWISRTCRQLTFNL